MNKKGQIKTTNAVLVITFIITTSFLPNVYADEPPLQNDETLWIKKTSLYESVYTIITLSERINKYSRLIEESNDPKRKEIF